jgi:hypothetical protein
MKSVEDEYGCQIDQEAILRGIACAYAAFACRLNAKDQARELLLDLAAKLDDPAMRGAGMAETLGEGSPPPSPPPSLNCIRA